MKIIRIFITKTNATPTDDLVRINAMPSLFDYGIADEIHISVTFTWDLKRADDLYKQWKHVAPTKIGGPATGEKGGDFVPEMYLKKGYVITSRGCNNNCWFCSVPKREGKLRELPITDGWIVTDDNLLACSSKHIDSVFEMLKKQPKRPQFVGGLESRLLTPQIAVKLKMLNPTVMYFAYDNPNNYEALVEAGKILRSVGFKQSNHQARCYVLCGYAGDNFANAEKRMIEAWQAGFMPFAMLFRDNSGKFNKEWKQFQRQWANHYIVASKLKKLK